MQAQLLNFRFMRWRPEEYVPQVASAQTLLRTALLNDAAPFAAVMRVLVTLDTCEWPSEFNLLYQTDEKANPDFDDHRQTNWHHRNAWGNLVPSAIDPPGCGCTECIIGEYIPWQHATPGMIRDLVAGYIANNTDQRHWVEYEVDEDDDWHQKLVSEYL
jgi:hypothetical protein